MSDLKRKLIRIVLVLVGIGILVYPSLSQFLTQQNSSRVISNYDDTVKNTNKDKMDAMLEEAREYNRLLASSTVSQDQSKAPDASLSLTDYNRILSLDSSGMIGYISIPKINSTARILHGTDESVLQTSIGHLQSTSLPVGGAGTHSVLVGHRGLPTAALFTDLDRLVKGDVFYIKVLDQTLCYTVDRISTVLPDELDDLSIEKDKDYVTLVTCTPYGVNSHRLLVRGVRTPFDEKQEIPVFAVSDIDCFWSGLPVQYRHALIGAGVIVVFLIIWVTVRSVIKKIKQRKEKS